MSVESSDSGVRELTKVVLALQEEVKSLKKLLIEQNECIKKLSANTVFSPSSVVEGRQVPMLGLPPQRPVREAGARAKSALASVDRPTRARKPTSPLIHALSQAAPTTATAASTSSSLALTSTIPTIQQHDYNCVTADQDLNGAVIFDNAAGWTEVRRRSRRPISNATCGIAAPGSTILQAAERKSYLHLYYVMFGTTAAQVAEHIATICPGDKCSVEALKSRGDYASFKLCVPTKTVDKYMSPQHWAADVYIKPWRSGFRGSQQQQEREIKI